MLQNETQVHTQQEMQICCQALDEKKAIDLKILDVRGKSSVTDYFIIATGNSTPHLRALKDVLHKAFKSNKVNVLGMDASHESGWIVIDVFDFIVHLFNEEMRAKYNLEALWKDAKIIDSEVYLKEEV